MNRIVMIAVAASMLITFSASSGQTTDKKPTAAIEPPAGAISESVLWSFGVPDDGVFPQAGLVADRWGNLYGTTKFGGANLCDGGTIGCGTVFKLSPPTRPHAPWREQVLWNFGANSLDGQLPVAGLIVDQWGNLYGTTLLGGDSCGGELEGCGIVFELSPPADSQKQWRETVLWNFNVSPNDGKTPGAGLLAERWGVLFGTTEGGGTNNQGTAFELIPPGRPHASWTERVIWNFGGSAGVGANPQAALIADKWGNLYGTTYYDGTEGFEAGGTVFELSPPSGQQAEWRHTVLWSFASALEFPSASLIIDERGNLYSTVGNTVFELKPPSRSSTQWSKTIVRTFGAPGDGSGPVGSLLADRWGDLYGATTAGGALDKNGGTVFVLIPPTGQQPQWTERLLWSFGAPGDGSAPVGDLIADQWGNLFGTTAGGGANEGGTVFELNGSSAGQSPYRR